MKSFYNKLNVIFTAFFVLGALLSAYNLYNLPVKMEMNSGSIDLNVIKELDPVFTQTYLIVGLTLVLGLGAIILGLYLLNYTKTAEKIIYVEKSETHKEDEEQKERQNQRDNLDLQVAQLWSGANAISDPKRKFEKVLSDLCMKLEASQGILYTVKKENGQRYIELFATFAYNLPESKTVKYEFGEGLAGQVAKEAKKINIKDIPKGYITIVSGLGASSPNHLAILPVKSGEEVAYVVEIASFKEISSTNEALIEEVLSKGIQTGKAEKPAAGSKGQEAKEEKKK
ncbi:MAG: GAF domain-containing protein [Cyclobacteriaceae bacterium]|nr:GAF domain-containing protein [Cyclobacteriaceae bacterium]